MVDTFKRKTDFKKTEPKEVKRPPIAGRFMEDEKSRLKHDTGESEMIVVGEMAGPNKVESKPETKESADSGTRWDIFLAYFFAPIGSLVLYLMNKEKRTVFHCKQSAVIGIIGMVLSFFLIGFLVWLYGLYVGYKAATGEDVEVPGITSALKK